MNNPSLICRYCVKPITQSAYSKMEECGHTFHLKCCFKDRIFADCLKYEKCELCRLEVRFYHIEQYCKLQRYGRIEMDLTSAYLLIAKLFTI